MCDLLAHRALWRVKRALPCLRVLARRMPIVQQLARRVRADAALLSALRVRGTRLLCSSCQVVGRAGTQLRSNVTLLQGFGWFV